MAWFRSRWHVTSPFLWISDFTIAYYTERSVSCYNCNHRWIGVGRDAWLPSYSQFNPITVLCIICASRRKSTTYLRKSWNSRGHRVRPAFCNYSPLSTRLRGRIPGTSVSKRGPLGVSLRLHVQLGGPLRLPPAMRGPMVVPYIPGESLRLSVSGTATMRFAPTVICNCSLCGRAGQAGERRFGGQRGHRPYSSPGLCGCTGRYLLSRCL
jgi:hypothetical protein